MNIGLWLAQGILPAVFLGAGTMKVTQPKAALEVKPGMGYMTELSAFQLKLIGIPEGRTVRERTIECDRHPGESGGPAQPPDASLKPSGFPRPCPGESRGRE